MEQLRRVRLVKRHGASALSVNEGAQVDGAVVGATKLPES